MFLILAAHGILKNLLKREEGQGLLEYGLVLLLISVAAIIVMTPLGGRMVELFQKIVAAMIAAI